MATEVRTIATQGPIPLITLQNIHAADFIFAGAYGRGMFRSTDSGQHWQKIKFRNGYIFVGADFVGGAGGVYCSGDYGESWVEISHDMIPTDLCALSTNPSGHIFAAFSNRQTMATAGRR